MDVILAQITKNLVLCLCSILIDLQNLYSWGLNKREGVYFFYFLRPTLLLILTPYVYSFSFENQKYVKMSEKYVKKMPKNGENRPFLVLF